MYAFRLAQPHITPHSQPISLHAQAARRRARPVTASAPPSDIVSVAASTQFEQQLRAFSELGEAELASALRENLGDEGPRAGTSAGVRMLRSSPALILRIAHHARHWVNNFKPGQVVKQIPVKYSGLLNALPGETTLGIPHAVLVPPDHDLSTRSSVSPAEILPEMNSRKNAYNVPLWLLRKCPGYHPADFHKKEYDALTGVADDFEKNNIPANQEISQLFTRLEFLALPPSPWLAPAVREQRMREAPQRRAEFFADCAAGTYSASGIQPAQQREFLKRVKAFYGAYTGTVAQLATMPQAAFDEAVATLSKLDQARNAVRLDMQHDGNITVDPQTKRFYFLDLSFRPDDIPRSRGAEFDEFLGVLLGKNAGSWQLVIDPQTMTALRPALQNIVDKLAAAIRANHLQWQSSDPSEIDELAERFNLSIPKRTPFEP